MAHVLSQKWLLNRRHFLKGLGVSMALLKLLHALGADPSILTVDKVTPLIAAAGLGTLAAGEVAGKESEVLEALDWLISIGEDVNALDANGETAMHLSLIHI